MEKVHFPHTKNGGPSQREGKYRAGLAGQKGIDLPHFPPEDVVFRMEGLFLPAFPGFNSEAAVVDPDVIQFIISFFPFRKLQDTVCGCQRDVGEKRFACPMMSVTVLPAVKINHEQRIQSTRKGRYFHVQNNGITGIIQAPDI